MRNKKSYMFVVSLHDYSVLTGKLNSKLNVADMKSQVSKLNSQLTLVRKNIVLFDKDLSYNWKVLIDNDNVNYPHRQLLKDFNLEGFTLYNFEVGLQKQINQCYKNSNSGLVCVKKLRSNSKKSFILWTPSYPPNINIECL